MSNRASGRSFSAFDKMSTEELEEILRLDAQLPEEEGCDTELILYIAEIIAKRERENPTGRLPDTDKAWKTFNEKYRPYTNDGRSLYEDEQSNIAEFSRVKSKSSAPDSSSPVRHMGRGLIRAACIAAVIVALAVAATATSYALGYDLWGHVAGWSKETFRFESENQTPSCPPLSQPIEDDLSDLQTALDKFGVTEKLVPKYIPEEFRQTDFYSSDLGHAIFLTAIFDNSEQTIIVDVVTNANTVSVHYSKDDGEPEIYEANGVEHYIMTNTGEYLAVWRNGNYEGSISGLESKDELIKMIDSIYEEK